MYQDMGGRGQTREVDVRQFLRDVTNLASQLPSRSVAINLCLDRYRFTVAFCAVIVRGQANALPVSQHVDVQKRVATVVDDSYVLHDGTAVDSSQDAFHLTADLLESDNDQQFAPESYTPDIPNIPLGQLSAICFSSGSTGEPTATRKSWRTLLLSSQANARYYLDSVSCPLTLLATVPPQHMYGLETSVLLPLFANVSVHHSRPLFPADIARLLNSIAGPTALVSTPLHLRALVNSGVELPGVALCLSATAPLAEDLAKEVFAATGALVREIYGCSEAGSLATRDVLKETRWRAYDCFRFRQIEQQTLLTADHLLSEVELQDVIEFTDDGSFEIKGRQSDMINIAGKRNSLTALTRVLDEMPAVDDCVVFLPNSSNGNTPRLAALVVSESLDTAQVQAWLRERMDNAFVPRSIVFVSELPRVSTGKLPREAVLRVFDEARGSGNAK